MEDEEDLRQPAAKLLRKAGFTVLEASDGYSALDVLGAGHQKFRVLILDLTLPGASSREVFEKATCLDPGMKVIVTSGRTEQAAASLPGRTHGFLQKPYRADELIDLIGSSLAA